MEEMLPLYRAVVHGCLSGDYQQSHNEIYEKRITRGTEYYSLFNLGAYSHDLTALVAFFPLGWRELRQTDLNEESQIELLGGSSYCLMSLGRLQEAIEPRTTHLKLSEKIEKWEEATIAARNLVNLHMPLGQLRLANSAAQLAIYYAQRSKNIVEQLRSHSYLAAVLYRSGNFSMALKHFQQAESLEQQCGNTYLLSFPGFCYCSLLLEFAYKNSELQAVIKRVSYSLQISTRRNLLLIIALDYLTLARIYVALDEFEQAENAFSQALLGIKKSGNIDDAPQFYLVRADFYLTQNQLDPAQADLNSAWEIIERCGMKLYQVDYLLIHGRYSLAIKDHDTALNHYIEAKQLIQETGYHLRDAELDLFAAKLRQQCGEEYRSTNPALYSKTAEDYLQKAKNRIAEIGQWGLMRVIERDFPEGVSQ